MIAKDFIISFSHVRPKDFEDKPLGKGGVTLCKIKTLEGVTLSEASATCSNKDNYCKETGRRVALNRAIEKLRPDIDYEEATDDVESNIGEIDRHFNRTIKKQLLDCYNNRRNQYKKKLKEAVCA